MTLYDQLRDMFLSAFRCGVGKAAYAETTELYAEAWLGIVGSICVELLYGNAVRTNLRKDAVIMLLRKAIRL